MVEPWREGKGRIGVLRIGHRPGRDKRITTHVCLTARALGADVVYVHEPDERVLESVDGVVKRFGGPFETHLVASWRDIMRSWKARGAQVVHLTMYGIPLDEAVSRLDAERDLLVVVGAEKVPWEVYEEAEVNVSVGSQPHSEVAALALFLDRATKGEWDLRPFEGEVRVVPSEKGKAVSKGNAQ
ncbi:MAG: tRNA (cytidine(56)-2'-O)-methyltransferase [Euryarchaeota archaeon]|nr:tRNA (cytidine(56)-2'-O)-methyltransferase [Euryarchaeota archaeon]